jgi:HEAT repeat protein
MRKFVLHTLLAAALAATVSSTACNSGDPNALETHVKKLDKADARDDAIKQLERIVSGIATDPEDPRRAEFAEKVVPKFVEIYDESDVAPYREAMLEMALKMRRAEALPLWSKALAVDSSSGIDGSADGHKRALLALQGIREAKAEAAGEPVTEAFKTLMAKPSKDSAVGAEGELRFEMAKTLGVLKTKGAVEPLIQSLETDETEQPKAIYKAAVDALGSIGDPTAVDALIAVQFSVGDFPGPQSIGERAIRALGAIGEVAVPHLIETMEGKNEKVNDLALQKGVPVQVVQQSAVRILGVIGSPKATEHVIVYMPQKDCAGDEKVDLSKLEDFDQDSAAGLRAFAANSLGFIGDASAVNALCECRNATHNPVDLWEITAALGRIGGASAFDCLEKIVRDNFYDPEEAVEEEFKYEIRWEGVRWMVLAAPPARVGEIAGLVEGNNAKVKEMVEERGWMNGVAVLEECKEDRACYETVMSDATKHWFAREVAAFNFARMSEPGDLDAAVKLARAFKTRDPEARINIAWLTGKVADRKPCPECVKALEDVMKAEELTKDATMQSAWITARQTIVKMSAEVTSEEG